ncbi:hypothetical protein MTO96_021741 [Rhipicephalus appendiculatus]
MATQDRTGPRESRRSTTRARLRSPVISPPLPRVAGLQPPVDLSVRSCRGQYSYSILTALATTAGPDDKHGLMPSKAPACRNKIERGVTSDEQLAALGTPTLYPQLLLLWGVLAASWRAF